MVTLRLERLSVQQSSLLKIIIQVRVQSVVRHNRIKVFWWFTGEPFNPYDYGVIQNLRKYGRVDPVPYDLTKVTLPVYIFYGDNDLLVGPDVSSVVMMSLI